MFWLLIIISYLIGVFCGGVLYRAKVCKESYGKLKQAHDDGETYLFLELNTTPDRIMEEDYVIFKVDKKKVIPRK